MALVIVVGDKLRFDEKFGKVQVKLGSSCISDSC